MRKSPIVIAALLIGAAPSLITAQDIASETAVTGDANQQDDDEFPWGLLGLLGLAGLLGMKRDDRANHTTRGNRN